MFSNSLDQREMHLTSKKKQASEEGKRGTDLENN